tara:strand:+ start:550 stop:1974 length:1425 start_codon:yes stop_codon:yes gene_type:complete
MGKVTGNILEMQQKLFGSKPKGKLNDLNKNQVQEFNRNIEKREKEVDRKFEGIKSEIENTQIELRSHKNKTRENEMKAKLVKDRVSEVVSKQESLIREVLAMRRNINKIQKSVFFEEDKEYSVGQIIPLYNGGEREDRFYSSSNMTLEKLRHSSNMYYSLAKMERSVYMEESEFLYGQIKEIIDIAEKQERKIKESKVSAARKIELEARKKADSVIEEAKNKVKTSIGKIRLERSEVLLEDSMLAKLVVENARYQEAVIGLLKATKLGGLSEINRAQDNLNKAKNEKDIAAENFKKAKNCLSKTRRETAQAVAEGASHSLDAQSAVDKVDIAEKALDVLEKETFLIDSHACERWKGVCRNSEWQLLGDWRNFDSALSVQNELIDEEGMADVNVAIAKLGNLNINLNPYDREDSQVVPIEDAHGRLLYNIMDILGIMKVAKMSERYERQDGYKKSGGINDHLVNIIREYINPDKN